MSIRFLLILGCILFSAGCVSVKQVQSHQLKYVEQLSDFNGSYSNRAKGVDSLSGRTLWRQLNLQMSGFKNEVPGGTVELRALNNKQIEITLLQGSKRINTAIISGKLKQNHFVSKHNRKIIPVPLIYGHFSNRQFQFSIDRQNNLNLNGINNQWGWVFVFLASQNSSYSNNYMKL